MKAAHSAARMADWKAAMMAALWAVLLAENSVALSAVLRAAW